MLRGLEIQARNFGVWRRLGRSKHIGYNHHRRMARYMGDRQHAGRLRRNHALAAIVTLSHFGESSSPWLATTASPLRTQRMTAANAFARFGKFLAKWVLTTIPNMMRKCESQRIYWRFEWWAWVDLNHRPRPYQGLLS